MALSYPLDEKKDYGDFGNLDEDGEAEKDPL